MAIGIRKTPHVSETRFYITKLVNNKMVVKNIRPTRSSLHRFSRLVKSGNYDLLSCETHHVLLKVVIQ
jgi:hypothetical protein